jgi:hypothetical protein
MHCIKALIDKDFSVATEKRASAQYYAMQHFFECRNNIAMKWACHRDTPKGKPGENRYSNRIVDINK